MNPADDEKNFRVEYPDEAGYPDGEGFLDEGTKPGEAADANPDADADSTADSSDHSGDDIDDDVTDFEQELDGPDEDQVTGSA
jgi:hypothetical protein